MLSVFFMGDCSCSLLGFLCFVLLLSYRRIKKVLSGIVLIPVGLKELLCFALVCNACASVLFVYAFSAKGKLFRITVAFLTSL